MSSAYWEVGQSLKQIATKIPGNVQNLTPSEMQDMLDVIKGLATDAYAEYAVHMGWVDSEEEAVENLIVETESPEVSDALCMVHLSEWLAAKRESSRWVLVSSSMETEKAYHAFSKGWIPKSHVISKYRVVSSQVAPYIDKIEWLTEKIKVGKVCQLELENGDDLYVTGVVTEINATGSAKATIKLMDDLVERVVDMNSICMIMILEEDEGEE